MPYGIRKVSKKPCYRVFNKVTKRVFAKCTAREQAKKQMRLLNAIMYNKNFVPYGRNTGKTGKTRKQKK